MEYIRVFERQKRGAVHYHLVVALTVDIRTGADIEAIRKGDYRTASKALRAEWAFWRKTARRYGFGRVNLQPIASTAEAITFYVGKYVSKHIGARKVEDKGVHLVEYSRRARIGSTQFAWVTPGAREWRRKVAKFAAKCGCESMEHLATLFGPRWAWTCYEVIYSIDCYDDDWDIRLLDVMRLPRLKVSKS